jgi:hypothetical protein
MKKLFSPYLVLIEDSAYKFTFTLVFLKQFPNSIDACFIKMMQNLKFINTLVSINQMLT